MDCTTNYSPPQTKKGIIMSTQKWNSILRQLNANEDIVQQTQQEKKYLQYLKDGSRDMTKHWTNTVKRDDSSLVVDHRKIKAQERALEDQKLIQELQINDNRIRREKIAKAQLMIERLQAGPRELESAAILSEVLKAREIHKNIKARFEQEQYDSSIYDNTPYNLQKLPWEQDQNQSLEAQNRKEEYKCELLNCIKTQRKNKVFCLKSMTEGEQKIREQIDRDVKAQIERERAILQRKKEIMRKNALEAMKMVEQRRLREKQENNIEDSINCIYTEGKREIMQMTKDTQKQVIINKMIAIDENTKNFMAHKRDNTQQEEESYKKAIQEINDKLDAQEIEKIKKDKEIKAAKIKYYIEETQRQKEEKKKKLEEFRWSVANRLKNEEVNKQFELSKFEDKRKKDEEHRNDILNQIKEKAENEKLEKIKNQQCTSVSYEEKDKFFFEYANQLIEDAKKKSRPILPFIKVIGNYKKINNVDPQKYVPPHLVSNIPIDDKQDLKLCGKPVIKYNLCELKQLNPTIQSYLV